MFKITRYDGAEQQGVTFVVEGRLAGPWVEELRNTCRMAAVNQQHGATIDLTGVTFVDAEGKALLAQLWQQGIRLRASGCLTRCMIEEITGNESCNRSEPH